MSTAPPRRGLVGPRPRQGTVPYVALLTCSSSVDAKPIDAIDREFDPIDELYKVKGNPECNYQLQPGFEAEMAYIYLD